VRAALAIVLALLPAQVRAQERVDLNIVNEGQHETQIVVFDRVCNVVLYRGVLVPEAETSIDCCTDSAGSCKLTIEDQRGQRQDFDSQPGTIYLQPR
jgi:hypothetical protein